MVNGQPLKVPACAALKTIRCDWGAWVRRQRHRCPRRKLPRRARAKNLKTKWSQRGVWCSRTPSGAGPGTDGILTGLWRPADLGSGLWTPGSTQGASSGGSSSSSSRSRVHPARYGTYVAYIHMYVRTCVCPGVCACAQHSIACVRVWCALLLLHLMGDSDERYQLTH